MQRLTTNNLDSNLALKGEVTFLGSSVENFSIIKQASNSHLILASKSTFS